jgi:hypothetical protein
MRLTAKPVDQAAYCSVALQRSPAELPLARGIGAQAATIGQVCGWRAMLGGARLLETRPCVGPGFRDSQSSEAGPHSKPTGAPARASLMRRRPRLCQVPIGTRRLDAY